MTPPERGQDPMGQGGGEHPEVPAPVGTLFVLTLYIVVLAGMWGSVYWIMLQRS